MKYCLKIILGLLTLFYLTFIPNQLMAQGNSIELKEIKKFCCYGWLPEFQDSIEIIVDIKKVNQKEKYCVLSKKRRKNYDLHCWTGMVGLESPTTWESRLKINFKKNKIAQIDFGQKRMYYRVKEIEEGEKYLLIKKK